MFDKTFNWMAWGILGGSLLLGCGEAVEEGPSGPNPLEGLGVMDAPTNQRTVLDVKTNAGVGDDVVVAGRIQDFVDGNALITLTDASLKSCLDEDGADCECPTPWDYCCVEPSEFARHTLTVEFHDDAGSLFKAGLKGFKGLDHLQPVAVVGTVNKKDDAGNVIIVGSSIYRN